MKPRSWPEGGSVDDVQDLLAPSRASAQHGAISRDETSQNAAFIGPLMSVKSASSAHRGGLTSAPNHPPRRTWTDTGSSHPELWSRPELSRLEQGFVDGVGEGRNPGHRRAERRHRRAVAPSRRQSGLRRQSSTAPRRKHFAVLPPGVLVQGVPARPARTHSRWQPSSTSAELRDRELRIWRHHP
jgi:hypothetical protein